MNYAGYSAFLIGRQTPKAIRERVKRVIDDRSPVYEDLSVRVTDDNYLEIHLYGASENGVWGFVAELDGFGLELVPDSGGPGEGGAGAVGWHEVLPSTIEALAEALKRWKAANPPFASRAEAEAAARVFYETEQEAHYREA